jgi:hypothetical protein
MMNEMPSHWCRLPDAVNKDIIKATFLQDSDNDSSRCSTLTSLFSLFGLLDPEFTWFDKWFASSYGRSLVTDELTSSGYLIHIVESLLSALDSLSTRQLHLDQMLLLRISWCLHVLVRCIQFENGRALFPISFKRAELLLLKKDWARECFQGMFFAF